MRACKAPPIPHFLPTSSSSTQPANVKWPLLSRRLVLLSLPLATFLLPNKASCSDTNSTNVNSTTPSGSLSSTLTSFNPISIVKRDASEAISRRISDALELLEKGGNCKLQVTLTKLLSVLLRYSLTDFTTTTFCLLPVSRVLSLYIGNGGHLDLGLFLSQGNVGIEQLSSFCF